MNGTPFYDGNYLPETTIIYKDGTWQLGEKVEEEPTIPTVSFVDVETAYGWNNKISDGSAASLLKFSEVLGDAASSTNQAANVGYDIATKMKLNGKTVNEWYQEDGKTTVSYAHAGNYVYFSIPEEYLALSSNEYPYLTLTIEEGTEFRNVKLSAVTLYCVNGYWVSTKPAVSSTVTLSSIGAYGWNNLEQNGAYNTILQYSANYIYRLSYTTLPTTFFQISLAFFH